MKNYLTNNAIQKVVKNIIKELTDVKIISIPNAAEIYIYMRSLLSSQFIKITIVSCKLLKNPKIRHPRYITWKSTQKIKSKKHH